MNRERCTELARDRSGAIALVTLFMAVFLVALLMHLIDLGQALLYRERMQEAADAVAFSAAVMHARGMNLLALINMVMAALLAVLVALNMIEAVLVVAMAIATACIPFPVGPCAAAIGTLPTFEAIRREVAAARDSIRPSMLSGLSMLNTASHGLKAIIPLGAQLTAIQTAKEHYSPPAAFGFVIPTRATLPVSDDAYSVLCGKAGKYVGKLVAYPFDQAGVPDFLVDAAISAIEELAESNPTWFCAADDQDHAPDPLQQKYTRHEPALPKSRACTDADPLDESTAALCAEAEEESRRSEPDPQTGQCGPGCDRALYDERARLARAACDPNEHPKRKNYHWQERTVIEHYVPTRAGLRRIPEADEVQPPRYRSSKTPPCYDLRTGRYDWSRDAAVDASGEPKPICELVQGGPGSTRREVVSVLRVFHCESKAVRKHEIEDLSKDPALGAHDEGDRSRSPQTMVDGVTLGGEALQLRSVVVGKPRTSYEGLVRLAAWGHAPAEAASPLSLPSALERLQVAQAEYYFAGASQQPREWLWRMSWRARLRRFRMPVADEEAASTAAPERDADFDVPSPALDFAQGCAEADGGDGAGCDGLTAELGSLEKWISH